MINIYIVIVNIEDITDSIFFHPYNVTNKPLLLICEVIISAMRMFLICTLKTVQ